MLRLSGTVSGALWLACALLVGACGKDNPTRPAVVDVTASVGPNAYIDHCPGVFSFTGSVTSTSGTVTYRWERSDGATGPEQTLSFAKSGTQTITDSWELSAVGTFWERVHVLSPMDLSSNKATFTNACGALAATVSARLTTQTSSQACPNTFDFAADITLNGPGTVKYRWERSDGTQRPDVTLTYSEAGTKTVTDSWPLSQIGNFWEEIHVLSPNNVTSGAGFTNSCGAATAVVASASPSGYQGDCPGTFDLSADITAYAGTITYRWERSDGTVGTERTLTFPVTGTKSVTDSWQVHAIGSNWARLHILTPTDLQSNMATFTNDCGALGPFGVTVVTARVDQLNNDGECPFTYSLAADISANGGGGVGTVTYRWERSDGTFGPVQSLSFNAAGTQTVTDYWLVSEEGSYWGRVHILTPNDLVSNNAEFSNYCGGCWWCDAASRR
jgi:hypothetical protein